MNRLCEQHPSRETHCHAVRVGVSRYYGINVILNSCYGTICKEYFSISVKAVIGHIAKNNKYMSIESKCKVFCRRESHSWSDDAFHRRVVCKVEEKYGAFEGARVLKILYEEICFFACDSHRSENDCECLFLPKNFCLTCNLSCEIIVGKPCSRKNRKLLTPNECIHTVD